MRCLKLLLSTLMLVIFIHIQSSSSVSTDEVTSPEVDGERSRIPRDSDTEVLNNSSSSTVGTSDDGNVESIVDPLEISDKEANNNASNKSPEGSISDEQNNNAKSPEKLPGEGKEVEATASTTVAPEPQGNGNKTISNEAPKSPSSENKASTTEVPKTPSNKDMTNSTEDSISPGNGNKTATTKAPKSSDSEDITSITEDPKSQGNGNKTATTKAPKSSVSEDKTSTTGASKSSGDDDQTNKNQETSGNETPFAPTDGSQTDPMNPGNDISKSTTDHIESEKSKASSEDDGGMSAGGKAALGIFISALIIALAIGGFVIYRKRNFTGRSLKEFFSSTIRYRTYSNETYKDDEGMLILPDRK